MGHRLPAWGGGPQCDGRRVVWGSLRGRADVVRVVFIARQLLGGCWVEGLDGDLGGDGGGDRADHREGGGLAGNRGDRQVNFDN